MPKAVCDDYLGPTSPAVFKLTAWLTHDAWKWKRVYQQIAEVYAAIPSACFAASDALTVDASTLNISSQLQLIKWDKWVSSTKGCQQLSRILPNPDTAEEPPLWRQRTDSPGNSLLPSDAAGPRVRVGTLLWTAILQHSLSAPKLNETTTIASAITSSVHVTFLSALTSPHMASYHLIPLHNYEPGLISSDKPLAEIPLYTNCHDCLVAASLGPTANAGFVQNRRRAKQCGTERL